MLIKELPINDIHRYRFISFSVGLLISYRDGKFEYTSYTTPFQWRTVNDFWGQYGEMYTWSIPVNDTKIDENKFSLFLDECLKIDGKRTIDLLRSLFWFEVPQIKFEDV